MGMPPERLLAEAAQTQARQGANASSFAPARHADPKSLTISQSQSHSPRATTQRFFDCARCQVRARERERPAARVRAARHPALPLVGMLGTARGTGVLGAPGP
jgi:hypothetical protein